MADAALPEGWRKHESSSRPGTFYYVNEHTGKSQWEVPTAPAEAGEEVRASHILIKHTGSRNPVSRRTGEQVTRSKEAAIEQLTKLMDDIKAGKQKFADVAKAVSDCSSCSRGGDLGPFGRGMMQKPFEDAAFGLDVGAVSSIVDTDSGVHLVLRTA